jgi:F-type H+-transporting ATPase subunit delta|tara:strand:- start:36 stop:581 length:546 start_codon:yes stop_codon:yes gene_type:complete
MINTRAANRYAKAFLSITKSEDDLMIMFKDMSSVKKAFEQSQELKLFIDSKVIKDTDKVETLKKVFPDLSAYSTNLLVHIMNSGRIDLFDDVAKCFVELYNEKMGNQNVILISASKLSHDILTEIKSKVKSLTSKTVYLTNKVDKNLIGGFILKVGDKQYDASFKQQLKNLEHEFFNISIQ